MNKIFLYTKLNGLMSKVLTTKFCDQAVLFPFPNFHFPQSLSFFYSVLKVWISKGLNHMIGKCSSLINEQILDVGN